MTFEDILAVAIIIIVAVTVVAFSYFWNQREDTLD
jgi:hypothetical protein